RTSFVRWRRTYTSPSWWMAPRACTPCSQSPSADDRPRKPNARPPRLRDIMKRLFRSLSVVVCLIAPVPARAQARTAVHILGRTASQQWKMDTALHLATDTVTLTFESGDGGPIYTVDFVAHHAPLKPVDLPDVVDIIVTQHPVEDDAPV